MNTPHLPLSHPLTSLIYTHTRTHTDDLLGGEFGYRLLEPFLDYNESSTTANNYDPWFPGCPVFDNINKDADLGCNFIRINKDGECVCVCV